MSISRAKDYSPMPIDEWDAAAVAVIKRIDELCIAKFGADAEDDLPSVKEERRLRCVENKARKDAIDQVIIDNPEELGTVLAQRACCDKKTIYLAKKRLRKQGLIPRERVK